MASGSHTTTKVGQAIKVARNHAGITQHELGERIGVRWLTISRYERGVSNVSVHRLDQIATAVGVDAADLLRDAA